MSRRGLERRKPAAEIMSLESGSGGSLGKEGELRMEAETTATDAIAMDGRSRKREMEKERRENGVLV